MQPLKRPETSENKSFKIKNVTDYKHLLEDGSTKKQASSIFGWVLDLRQKTEYDQKIKTTSDFHDQLSKKDKHPNKTVAEFNLGDISNVRHLLDKKIKSNVDCGFMNDLRKYKNKNSDIIKEKWINTP